MTDNVLALDFNGVKVLLDANTKLIRLTCPSVSVVTTFHNTEDNSNYQVPTGKKAKFIFLEFLGSTNVADQWGFADDADGNTNAVVLIQPGSTTNLVNLIFISDSIPADKFVNFLRVAGTTASEQVIFIIEEDA